MALIKKRKEKKGWSCKKCNGVNWRRHKGKRYCMECGLK